MYMFMEAFSVDSTQRKTVQQHNMCAFICCII